MVGWVEERNPTLTWEPYIGKEIKNNGYVAVLVKEAFRRGGLEADFQFDRWSRVVGLAKSGQVDGYFPEYFSESVKAYAVFSDPFPGGPIGFFKLKRKDISFNRLEDLKGLKIGTVKGYVNTKEFDAADYLNKDAVKDDLTNFKKLAAGRLDLVVADKFVGLNLIKKHMPDKAGQIEFMAKFLGRSTIVLFFLKLHFDNPFFTRYRWVPRMATRTTMAFLLLDDRVLRFCQICQTKVNKYKIK